MGNFYYRGTKKWGPPRFYIRTATFNLLVNNLELGVNRKVAKLTPAYSVVVKTKTGCEVLQKNRRILQHCSAEAHCLGLS